VRYWRASSRRVGDESTIPTELHARIERMTQDLDPFVSEPIARAITRCSGLLGELDRSREDLDHE